MTTISNTFRLPKDISEVLRKMAVPPYSKAYLVTEALKAYKPIKKALADRLTAVDEPNQKSLITAAPVKKEARPTFDELSEYFWQSGKFDNYNQCKDQAETFKNHFDSNGWKIGGKTPMKDWRAAVRNWIKRNSPNGQANKGQQRASNTGKPTILDQRADQKRRMEARKRTRGQDVADVGRDDRVISTQLGQS